MNSRTIAILTAAKNEEAYIRLTLDSVVSQTLKPSLWVIVSDGSIDRTDSIVAEYAQRFSYIRLLRREADNKRDFRSKSDALALAITQLEELPFEYVCNLDSDISFLETYFERLVNEFKKDTSLGIAGGLVIENAGDRQFPQHISENSVAGAVQCFRMECFQQIGGFIRSEFGGEDAAAEIVARMKGWRVKTFRELRVIHHGYQKNLGQFVLRKRFRWGRMFYLLGYHPMFLVARCLKRVLEHPLILGSFAELAGFLAARLKAKKVQRLLPSQAIEYLRREQLERLFKPFRRCQ